MAAFAAGTSFPTSPRATCRPVPSTPRGLALAIHYVWDSVGNLTGLLDPKGNDTSLFVNELNQVLRVTSREVEPGGARYVRETHYDANDNLVRLDVQNLDDQGNPGANPWFTTVHEYDILDQTVRTCREAGSYNGPIPGTAQLPTCSGLASPVFVVTEFEYDANRNLTLTRKGEAASGNQPANTVRELYDERDLLFRTIRAEGDPGQSTFQTDYDPNENVEHTRQGIEDVAGQRIHEFAYDAFDRRISRDDPMGNVTTLGYDGNDNLETIEIEGELSDVAGAAGNVRLYEATLGYDEMDRLITRTVEFFDPASQQPLDDGQQFTKVDYADDSQIVTVTNDRGHAATYDYDTASRISGVTDVKSNAVTFTYDANSNVTEVLETDRSDLLNPDQLFTTSLEFRRPGPPDPGRGQRGKHRRPLPRFSEQQDENMGRAAQRNHVTGQRDRLRIRWSGQADLRGPGAHGRRHG